MSSALQAESLPTELSGKPLTAVVWVQFLIGELGSLQARRPKKKKKNSAASGQGAGFPSRDTQNNVLELFCRYWNPYQVGEVNWKMPTSTCRPQTGWKTEGWWCWLPLTTSAAHQKSVHELITPCLNHSYKTLTTPSTLGHTVLKLFFSTSFLLHPKLLSPKLNSVLGYRGWIHLQAPSSRVITSPTLLWS